MTKEKRRIVIWWLRNFICGALIGAGAILPGLSGGVFAVVFGIYHPFMEVLTHPFRSLSKYWTWFLPIILGWCIGFMGLAQGINAMLKYSEPVTIWLFIGLIIGTLPSMFRDAGKEGRKPSCWVSLLICFAVMFSGLFYMSRVAGVHVEPSFWWYNFCGALWGMSVVIPGMTSSSIMMALDLYEPMMEGLANMEFLVLATALPGMFITIALLARLMTWLFRTYTAIANHGILGIVIASTLVIVPTAYHSFGEVLLSAACGLGGFFAAYGMSRLDEAIPKEKIIE